MAASIKTLHTLDIINDVYGSDWFTAHQFDALEIGTHDNFVTLKTLCKHGLIERRYVVAFYHVYSEWDIQPDEWMGDEIRVSATEWACPYYQPIYRIV